MRYIVCTLIDVPGEMPDATDPDAVDAFLAKSLEPGAIKGAWFYPVTLDAIDDLPRPNVSGGDTLQ